MSLLQERTVRTGRRKRARVFFLVVFILVGFYGLILKLMEIVSKMEGFPAHSYSSNPILNRISGLSLSRKLSWVGTRTVLMSGPFTAVA